MYEVSKYDELQDVYDGEEGNPLQNEKWHRQKNLISNNSDIFARCSCSCRFHKFFRNDPKHQGCIWCRKSQFYKTLRTHKSSPGLHFFWRLINQKHRIMLSMQLRGTYSEDTRDFSFNATVPGLPPRSPTAEPMPNLELAKAQHYFKYSYIHSMMRCLACVWHSFYFLKFKLIPISMSVYFTIYQQTKQ